MTVPHERRRAVIWAREFLLRLCTPYGDGYKKIPKPVRDEARRVLRHFPMKHDLRGPEFEDDGGLHALIDEKNTEIARLLITDEERVALKWFARCGQPTHHAAALASLLERTK